MFLITGIFGVALIASPFLLGFTHHSAALWASIILGAIVWAVSFFGEATMAEAKRWMYWVMGLAGVGAFIAPFVFGYTDHAQPLWAGLILGALLALVDGYKAFQPAPRMEAL